MKHIKLENLEIMVDDNPDNERPIIIACKDRACISEERMVVVSLNMDEFYQIYDELYDIF